MGIVEVDTIKQAEIKEKIFKKSTSRERENYLKLNYEAETSSPGLNPRKIIRTILKVDEGRISTNRTKNKKTKDHA